MKVGHRGKFFATSDCLKRMLQRIGTETDVRRLPSEIVIRCFTAAPLSR
jgi:hypothetical protein